MKENRININKTDQWPRFIAIEGPIGVGKTSLAKRIAEAFDYQTLLENTESNPFLKSFYENQTKNALATQLSFLFQRSQQIMDLQQSDLFESTCVADFLIEKDKLFAEAILSPEEFKLYDQVHEQMDIEAPVPDLVIYLQASAPVLMNRIEQRGVQSEMHISAQYLEQINEAYSRFFLYYDDAPLLIINVEQMDLIHDDIAFNNLVEYMLTIQNGRHYFNPSFFTEAFA